MSVRRGRGRRGADRVGPVMVARKTALVALWVLASVVRAQDAPQFEVDPSWPKPLPEGWINAQLGGACVDSHDHIVIVDRRNITEEEAETSVATPPILMFDAAGNLVASWGDPDRVPQRIHGCGFDAEHNVWVAGNRDGIIQKYSHSGELLMQIGTRGVVDTHDGRAVMAEDGTLDREPLNASREGFFYPAAMAIDPHNGDIFVADGYGNKRVAVFDRAGRFLRQWGRRATQAEMDAGAPGVFAYALHCVAISRAGLVYVCDREGDRIQVFDKLGNFVRNIWIRTGTATLPDPRGTVWGVAFSPDEGQRYLYVLNGRNEQVHVLDHASGKILSTFGRPGHQIGHFTVAHGIAVDSQGNIYVAESGTGRRVQRFRPAGN